MINEQEQFKSKVNNLLGLIADAHKRMATNRDEHYRGIQQNKIDGWQEELTTLHERNVALWIQNQ